MEEKEYRKRVDEAFKKIATAFDSVDPDLAEFELSQGAVTIEYSNGTRCILSTQPSVRQVWLAAASKGVAFHFDYNASTDRWMDDKGKGIELFTYVRTLTKEIAGVDVRL